MNVWAALRHTRRALAIRRHPLNRSRGKALAGRCRRLAVASCREVRRHAATPGCHMRGVEDYNNGLWNVGSFTIVGFGMVGIFNPRL